MCSLVPRALLSTVVAMSRNDALNSTEIRITGSAANSCYNQPYNSAGASLKGSFPVPQRGCPISADRKLLLKRFKASEALSTRKDISESSEALFRL